jgi:hypothetical protein
MRKPRSDRGKPKGRSGKIRVCYFISTRARDKLRSYSERVEIPQGVIVESLILTNCIPNYFWGQSLATQQENNQISE